MEIRYKVALLLILCYLSCDISDGVAAVEMKQPRGCHGWPNPPINVRHPPPPTPGLSFSMPMIAAPHPRKSNSIRALAHARPTVEPSHVRP